MPAALKFCSGSFASETDARLDCFLCNMPLLVAALTSLICSGLQTAPASRWTVMGASRSCPSSSRLRSLRTWWPSVNALTPCWVVVAQSPQGADSQNCVWGCAACQNIDVVVWCSMLSAGQSGAITSGPKCGCNSKIRFINLHAV